MNNKIMDRRSFLKNLLIGIAGGSVVSTVPTFAASLQGFGSQTNFNTKLFPSGIRSPKTRYVSKGGNDANDGLRLDTAKLTVRAAVESLPEEGGGVQRRKAGDIYISEGEYIENAVGVPSGQNYLIECSCNIRFHGIGVPVGSSPAGGTALKLGDNVNKHFFGPRSTFTDFAHNIYFEDMIIDGNKDKNSGNYDLIRLFQTGFNTSLRNISLRNAPRNGIAIVNHAVNFYAYNVTGAGCTRFFHYDSAPSSNNINIGFWGVQIDDCGQYPFEISARMNGTGNFFIDGLEAEAFSLNQHQAIIKYNPISGHNGLNLDFSNMIAWKAGSARAIDESVLFIADGKGSGPFTTYKNLINDGYDWVFKDLKNSLYSKQRQFAVMGRSKWTAMQFGPVGWYTAQTNPENHIPANPGSICSVTDGSFYIKKRGEGKIGWEKVSTT